MLITFFEQPNFHHTFRKKLEYFMSSSALYMSQKHEKSWKSFKKLNRMEAVILDDLSHNIQDGRFPVERVPM